MQLDPIEKYDFSNNPDPAERIFSLNNDNSNALLIAWLYLVTKRGFQTDATRIISGTQEPTFISLDDLSDHTRLNDDTLKAILMAYTDPPVPDDQKSHVQQAFQTVADAFQRLARSLSNGNYRPDQYGDAEMMYRICDEGATVDPSQP